jgi:acyl-homoserine-lactone acylase
MNDISAGQLESPAPKGKRPYWKWRVFSLASLFLVLSVATWQLLATAASARPAAPLEPHQNAVLWDTWGVPHVYATDTASLFYEFGWAQMKSHADLLLRLYGQARGRAAEYWGSDYLASDELVHTMGFPEQAQHWYEAQSPEWRTNLNRFVAGMNAYAERHPNEIDPQVRVVLPIQVTDVFAHLQRVLFTFLVGDNSCGGSFNSGSLGSNGWAIAPVHATSGSTMLLANPHLPWGDLFTFYEAQLVAPGTNLYGATLVGFPVLTIAFNTFLSWTVTVNTLDSCTLYALTLAGNGYLFDGQIRSFETSTQTLKIRQSDGTLKEQPLVVRRSIQGPVFVVNGQALALRVVGVDQFPAYGSFQEWWEMGHARNLHELQEALRRLQIPRFTIIAADRAGHILSLFNGQVPKRPFGDWNDWAGVVPGDTSRTLWTALLPYDNLPKVVDPASGWVQNANSPPWYMTFPQTLHPEQYPAYLAPIGEMSLREQRSVEMLTAQSRLSFEQMISDKFSSHAEMADRVLDDLIAAAQTSGDVLAQQAAQVLQSWDRNFDAASRGAVLFAEWAHLLQQRQAPFFAVPWDATQPRTTPRGLADPQAAVAALDAAAKQVQAQYGALDIPWGQIFRLHRGASDYPGSGGPDDLGIFRVVEYDPGANGQFYADDGDSYIAAVEFSSSGVMQARVLLTYGNSSQPDSPHNGDQLALYAHNQLRTAWLTYQAVGQHLEARDLF